MGSEFQAHRGASVIRGGSVPPDRAATVVAIRGLVVPAAAARVIRVKAVVVVIHRAARGRCRRNRGPAR